MIEVSPDGTGAYASCFGSTQLQMILASVAEGNTAAQTQAFFHPANALLILLQDKSYVERLKRHYRMFRATIDDEG